MRAKPLMRNPKPSQTMRGCHAHWRRNLVQRKASRVTHPVKSSSVSSPCATSDCWACKDGRQAGAIGWRQTRQRAVLPSSIVLWTGVPKCWESLRVWRMYSPSEIASQVFEKLLMIFPSHTAIGNHSPYPRHFHVDLWRIWAPRIKMLSKSLRRAEKSLAQAESEFFRWKSCFYDLVWCYFWVVS